MKSSHVEPDLRFGGGLGWVPLVIPIDDIGASLNNLVITRIKIPFRFQVMAVSMYAPTIVGGVFLGLRVTSPLFVGNTILGATSFPSTSGPPLSPPLTGPVATQRGMGGDFIEVVMTTDAGASADGGNVTVWVRPYPMKGEA